VALVAAEATAPPVQPAVPATTVARPKPASAPVVRAEPKPAAKPKPEAKPAGTKKPATPAGYDLF